MIGLLLATLIIPSEIPASCQLDYSQDYQVSLIETQIIGNSLGIPKTVRYCKTEKLCIMEGFLRKQLDASSGRKFTFIYQTNDVV